MASGIPLNKDHEYNKFTPSTAERQVDMGFIYQCRDYTIH